MAGGGLGIASTLRPSHWAGTLHPPPTAFRWLEGGGRAWLQQFPRDDLAECIAAALRNFQSFFLVLEMQTFAKNWTSLLWWSYLPLFCFSTWLLYHFGPWLCVWTQSFYFLSLIFRDQRKTIPSPLLPLSSTQIISSHPSFSFAGLFAATQEGGGRRDPGHWLQAHRSCANCLALNATDQPVIVFARCYVLLCVCGTHSLFYLLSLRSWGYTTPCSYDGHSSFTPGLRDVITGVCVCVRARGRTCVHVCACVCVF